MLRQLFELAPESIFIYQLREVVDSEEWEGVMDNNQNRITSVDQFRHELRALLERARKNLEKDKGLANVALLNGYPTSKQLLLINVPADQTNVHLRGEVRNGNYESVVFIALAAAAPQTGEGDTTHFRATSKVEDLGVKLEDARLCIVVEGSHRDFGNHAAHLEFVREGESQFTFGRSDCGPLTGGVLANLWPKRKLNS